MYIDTFELERNQTLYENDVEFNLTESGIHPCTIRDILDETEIEQLLSMPLAYGYTDGTPELKDRIAQWYPKATAANIAVTQGAQEANLITLLSTLDKDDELLFIVPNFMQLTGLAKCFGIQTKLFTLSADNQWQPDLVALSDAMTPRTKMIAMVNPNNPTGIVASPETMQGLVDIAAKNDCYLLADEIYRGAEINREETPSYFGMYDRVIVTSSLSKAFANPGIRLGWMVAPPDVIESAVRFQDYTTIGTNCLSQALGEKIMKPGMREKILARTRMILSENVKILSDWMACHQDYFTWIEPQSGGMAFIGYKWRMSSIEFSNKLREEENVFVVAGSWFGLDHYIRLGIGVEKYLLVGALDRLSNFAKRQAA